MDLIIAINDSTNLKNRKRFVRPLTNLLFYLKFKDELCPLIQQTCGVRALTLASCLLPPVEYNGIHDEDIFLGDGSHIETIGKNYAVFSDTICFCKY